jgi:hypothetical protein
LYVPRKDAGIELMLVEGAYTVETTKSVKYVKGKEDSLVQTVKDTPT